MLNPRVQYMYLPMTYAELRGPLYGSINRVYQGYLARRSGAFLSAGTLPCDFSLPQAMDSMTYKNLFELLAVVRFEIQTSLLRMEAAGSSSKLIPTSRPSRPSL
jgi:hypothetical protein